VTDKAMNAATGRVLRSHRKAAGLSLRAVQAQGGPSIPFQSDVENGKRGVSLAVLIRWCKALGCQPPAVVNEIQFDLEYRRVEPIYC
jgi:transcriptional regulator with XRE-family HTH domain